MATTRSSQIKIALLVIASIILFIFGFSYLKGSSLLSKSTSYYAIFDNSGSLGNSDKVTLLGTEVGKVESVELVEDYQKIRVNFFIDNGMKLPDDSEVTISAGIPGFGSSALILNRGKSSSFLATGAEVKTRESYGLMDQADEVMGNVNPVLKNLNNVLLRLDSVAVGVQGLVSGENGLKLEKTISSLESTAQNFNASSRKLNGMLENSAPQIETMISNLNSISSNLKNNEAQINDILANLSKTSDNLAALELKETVDQANEVMTELNTVLEKVNTGDGSLSLLLNDADLYNNLNNTARDLDRLILDLKENPRDFIPNVSVFGKKDKKEKDK